MQVNKRFGFLDSGKDQEALIAALHSYLVYASHVGIYHEFHSLLSRVLCWFPGGGIGHLAAFTSQQIAEGHKIFTSKNSDDNSDPFLKRLLRVHSQNPEKISQADIFTTCITNIGAGSDSTSVSLTAILYNLCKHPKVYRKVCPAFVAHQCTPLVLTSPAPRRNRASTGRTQDFCTRHHFPRSTSPTLFASMY